MHCGPFTSMSHHTLFSTSSYLKLAVTASSVSDITHILAPKSLPLRYPRPKIVLYGTRDMPIHIIYMPVLVPESINRLNKIFGNKGK